MTVSVGAPLVGLLLAAGRGSRFDALGERNKLLARIDDRPILAISAAKLRAVVDHLLVVFRPDSAALRPSVDGIDVTIVECPDAGLGMGHSLAYGTACAIERFGPRALLVGLADMPFVSEQTLQHMAKLADSDEVIAAPSHRGKRGHPVLFGRSHFAALQECRGDSGAGHLLGSRPVHLVELDDPGVLRDVDRPEDLPSKESGH